MKKVFKDCVTGLDGVTYDPARVLWIIGVVVFLVLVGITVYHTGVFNMTEFGLAYSGLLAGGAAGVKVK